MLADVDVGGFGASGELVGKQTLIVFICAAYSYLVTAVGLFLMSKIVRLTPTAEEMINLDLVLHGEDAYNAKPKRAVNSHTTPIDDAHKGVTSVMTLSKGEQPPSMGATTKAFGSVATLPTNNHANNEKVIAY